MPKKTTTVQAATKKDIQSVRNDVKRSSKTLRTEILKVEEKTENLEESIGYVEERIERVEYKIERVETKMDKMDKKLDNLQNTLDGFVGTVETLSEENVVGAEHYRDHEKRIAKLESVAQPA